MINPKVMQATIYHKRMFPKVNRFSYKLTYLALPLSRLENMSIGFLFRVNRPAILSFWGSDHGDKRSANLRGWVDRLLLSNDIDDVDGEIVLITMPRLFGYVFNPVSFWLCYQKDGTLRAVIAEVNNTFGETHSYVCAAEDRRTISASDCFYADKDFHVSPFLQRNGYYRFVFDSSEKKFNVRIDYFNAENSLQLETSISASCSAWSRSNLMIGWVKSPLMALKAIFLIHWQALKLVFRSAGYKPKPIQNQFLQTRATERAPHILEGKTTIDVLEEHSCI